MLILVAKTTVQRQAQLQIALLRMPWPHLTIGQEVQCPDSLR